MVAVSALKFAGVPESADAFLALFPHRFDFLYAAYPEAGFSPHWQTESRYPLSDRTIRQSTCLYGVRFGSQTRYCLLDIDRGSRYHPARDPWAIDRILAALEPLGLVGYVACTSSASEGIHLYFPFEVAQQSWELASAIALLLEQSGFKLVPGQLEVFPNPKSYRAEGKQSLFNGHRLPLQIGSYLLNQDFQPIWTDETTFVQRWQFAEAKNDLNELALKRILKQAKRKVDRLSGKADKFLNDLNAEIEAGWTDFGQTNYLLGRIAMRTYVFHPVLSGEPPLIGQELVDEIVRVARSLPGYKEWCRHQAEIVERATEWARCVEASHYFPYGFSQGKYKPKKESVSDQEDKVSWNDRQANSARERIKQATVELRDSDRLPSGITARFQILTQCGISGRSLYRNRDLWHPQYLVETDLTAVEPIVECIGSTESTETRNSQGIREIEKGVVTSIEDEETVRQSYPSLLPQVDANALSHQASAYLDESESVDRGGNCLSTAAGWGDRLQDTAGIEQETDEHPDSFYPMHRPLRGCLLSSTKPYLVVSAECSLSAS